MAAVKDSSGAECLRLKEDLNSRQIQIDSLENRVKVDFEFHKIFKKKWESSQLIQ